MEGFALPIAYKIRLETAVFELLYISWKWCNSQGNAYIYKINKCGFSDFHGLSYWSFNQPVTSVKLCSILWLFHFVQFFKLCSILWAISLNFNSFRYFSTLGISLRCIPAFLLKLLSFTNWLISLHLWLEHLQLSARPKSGLTDPIYHCLVGVYRGL